MNKIRRAWRAERRENPKTDFPFLKSLCSLRSTPHAIRFTGFCSGFTLVELLITSTLMTFVLVAVVSVLTGGIRVWQRAQEMGTHDQTVLLTLERMRRDFLNVRRFEPVPFEGAYDQFSLAAVDFDLDGKSVVREIGSMGYYLDPKEKSLCRYFVPYHRLRRVRKRSVCQTMLENVSRIRLSYLEVEEGEKEIQGKWRNAWKDSNPPAAIRLSLSFKNQKQPYVMTVPLMLSSVEIEEKDS